MKIKRAEFLTSSPSLEKCPETNLPEFALIGRSNVGKSSLLNFLVDRNALASTSSKPGHTKLINFFPIDRTWCLVDLPGYGFVTDGKHFREKFSKVVADYISQRENLRCVFVLVDSSIPAQNVDLEFIHWLTQQLVPFVLVFTKTDKATVGKVTRHIEAFKERIAEFADNLPLIYQTSAREKAGKQELLDLIEQILANKPSEAS